MSSLRSLRTSLVEASRRYSRLAHEAEDLAHDLVLAALKRGVTLDDPALLRGAHGSARRHGAFLARTAGRRRARELGAGVLLHPEPEIDGDAGGLEGAPLEALPDSLRTTLLLLFLGMDKAELRVALGINDAALRKRFQAMRERAPLARPTIPLPFRTPSRRRLRRVQRDILRQLDGLQRGPGPGGRHLAAADPDGHGVIFTEVLTSRGSAATPLAPRSFDGTNPKGTPCSRTSSATSPSSSRSRT